MLFNIILATSIISLLSLIGILAIHKKNLHKSKWLNYLISFAAGVMLSISFIELIPEAIANSHHSNILIYTLFGIIAFFILERSIHWFHCHKPHNHVKPAGTLVIIGDTLHNFFDGLAIAAGFAINPVVGWGTTLAIASHEIPQEIADFSVLVHSGIKPKKALFLNFISALTAVLGGIIGFMALSTAVTLQPYFLAITAGMFIYISLSDLIPELHQYQPKNWLSTITPFIIGVIMIWGIIEVTHNNDLHSHDHDGHHLEEDYDHPEHHDEDYDLHHDEHEDERHKEDEDSLDPFL